MNKFAQRRHCREFQRTTSSPSSVLVWVLLPFPAFFILTKITKLLPSTAVYSRKLGCRWLQPQPGCSLAEAPTAARSSQSSQFSVPRGQEIEQAQPGGLSIE